MFSTTSGSTSSDEGNSPRKNSMKLTQKDSMNFRNLTTSTDVFTANNNKQQYLAFSKSRTVFPHNPVCLPNHIASSFPLSKSLKVRDTTMAFSELRAASRLLEEVDRKSQAALSSELWARNTANSRRVISLKKSIGSLKLP
jgi:hypothetical protein